MGYDLKMLIKILTILFITRGKMSYAMSELDRVAGQREQVVESIKTLDDQIGRMRESTRLNSDSIESIKALNKEGTSDILCFAGPNIMFRAKVVEPDTILVKISQDVVIEKSAEEALNMCESAIKNGQIMIENLLKMRYNYEMHLADLNQQLTKLVNAQAER